MHSRRTSATPSATNTPNAGPRIQVAPMPSAVAPARPSTPRATSTAPGDAGAERAALQLIERVRGDTKRKPKGEQRAEHDARVGRR